MERSLCCVGLILSTDITQSEADFLRALNELPIRDARRRLADARETRSVGPWCRLMSARNDVYLRHDTGAGLGPSKTFRRPVAEIYRRARCLVVGDRENAIGRRTRGGVRSSGDILRSRLSRPLASGLSSRILRDALHRCFYRSSNFGSLGHHARGFRAEPTLMPCRRSVGAFLARAGLTLKTPEQSHPSGVPTCLSGFILPRDSAPPII